MFGGFVAGLRVVFPFLRLVPGLGLIITGLTLAGLGIAYFRSKDGDSRPAETQPLEGMADDRGFFPGNPTIDKPEGVVGRIQRWLSELFSSGPVEGNAPIAVETLQVPTHTYGGVSVSDSVAGSRPSYSVNVADVSQDMMGLMKTASYISGISVPVLLAVANKESRLGKYKVASTSSARGILQLLPGTFDEMVRKYGKKFNFSDINKDRDNVIAGALYLKDMVSVFKSRVTSSRPISLTELYLMYLLGPGGGARFIKRFSDNPNDTTIAEFGAQAAANKSVFYHKNGNARTYKEVFSYLFTEVEQVAANIGQQLTVSSVQEKVPAVKSGEALIGDTKLAKADVEFVPQVGPAQQRMDIPEFKLPPPTAYEDIDVPEERSFLPSGPGAVNKPQGVLIGPNGLRIAS